MNSLTLTSKENDCLRKLEEAWGLFIKMPRVHPSELQDFQSAIHIAQGIIGLRVAKRVNPEIWK